MNEDSVMNQILEICHKFTDNDIKIELKNLVKSGKEPRNYGVFKNFPFRFKQSQPRLVGIQRQCAARSKITQKTHNSFNFSRIRLVFWIFSRILRRWEPL
jgi:hypothetical protein